MELKFEVNAKIQKPVSDVFEAVRNPTTLSRYFTSGGASAPLKEGTTVEWGFADVPESRGGGSVRFPVKVTRVIDDELIEFEWKAADGDYSTRVQMRFKSLGPSDTLVSITETGWKETPSGLASSYSNCGGWTQMACSLKAYVEYGINLRKGYT